MISKTASAWINTGRTGQMTTSAAPGARQASSND